MVWLGALTVILGLALLTPGSLESATDSGAAPSETAVIARDGSGSEAKPCPPVRRPEPDLVEGGCVLRVDTRGVAIAINSVVGKLSLSSCLLKYVMRVDASGRTVLHEMVIDGPSPCNDVRPCYDDEYLYPLDGRIVLAGDGELINVVDMCLDTCLGRFEGPLELLLRGGGTEWRAKADRALVGVSGWEFDGSWALRTDGLDVEPADRSAVAPGD